MKISYPHGLLFAGNQLSETRQLPRSIRLDDATQSGPRAFVHAAVCVCLSLPVGGDQRATETRHPLHAVGRCATLLYL